MMVKIRSVVVMALMIQSFSALAYKAKWVENCSTGSSLGSTKYSSPKEACANARRVSGKAKFNGKIEYNSSEKLWMCGGDDVKNPWPCWSDAKCDNSVDSLIKDSSGNGTCTPGRG